MSKPLIFVELDHIEWIKKTFSPNSHRLYLESVCRSVIETIGTEGSLISIAEDSLRISTTCETDEETLSLAQILSVRLNSLTCTLEDRAISGAASIEVKFM